jgi:hypothetical protein
MIVGPELLRLLTDTVACCAGEHQGSGMDLIWTATVSCRRWFPGLPERTRAEIVAEIVEELNRERTTRSVD